MSAHDQSIFNPENYRETRAPIHQASPLPKDVYFSQEWYDREMETIFRKSWLIATREEEIPNAGDYIRVDLVETPLIIVRDKQKNVHALSAACRHRGAELAEGKGNCKRLVCPYHAWTYALSGELIGAPGMQSAEGFEKSDHNLPTLKVGTWGGFVFVNFDPDAKPLIESLGGMIERFKDYKLEDMHVMKKWDNRFNANWKIWVENSREGYHVPTIHKGSLGKHYPGLKYSGFSTSGEPNIYMINSSSNETGLYVPREKTLPFVDGLREEDQQQTHFVIHYPSLLLNMPPDRITFHQYFPEGPEWTRLVTWCCFPKSTIDLPNFENDFKELYLDQMDMFIQEDKGACEIVHRGLQGQFSEMGRFSPDEEETVYEFSNWVLDRVIGPVNGVSA